MIFITHVPGTRECVTPRFLKDADIRIATPGSLGSGKGLAPALNSILRHCREKGIKKFWIADDDVLRLEYRGECPVCLQDVEWPADCALGSKTYPRHPGAPPAAEFEAGASDQLNFYNLELIPDDVWFREDMPVWEVLEFACQLRGRGIRCYVSNSLACETGRNRTLISTLEYRRQRNANCARLWPEQFAGGGIWSFNLGAKASNGN